LSNFFRICQHHAEELVRYLQFTVISRALHHLYARQIPADLTDIQRAARFLYLQKTAYGGLVRKRAYHLHVTKAPNLNPLRLPALIRATADRLARVQIEALPYEQVLDRFDTADTLFYCDPPYLGREPYRFNFSDEDFVRLADQLSRLKGTFLLTINDCEQTRQIFQRFNMRPISFAYTAARNVPRVQELLFSNYDWPSVETASI
jgi:DNA adenine methylase